MFVLLLSLSAITAALHVGAAEEEAKAPPPLHWFDTLAQRQAAQALAAQWQVLEAANLVAEGELPDASMPPQQAERAYNQLYARLALFWRLLAEQPWDGLNLEALSTLWLQEGQKLTGNGPASMAPSTSVYQAVLALEPQVPHYLALRNRIGRLHYLERVPQPKIEAWGVIKPGESHHELPAIRTYLEMLGDFSGPLNSQVYDPFLEQAVRQFQARHGLEVDGVIGPKTRQWLRMPMAERARRLARSLIRRVHDQHHFAESYLLVNIPQYQLWWRDEGETRFSSRVVVGMPSRATPRMHTQLSSVVVNPPWNVPKSILYKDLLPRIRQDGNYAANNGFQVLGRNNQAVSLSAEQLADFARGRFPFSLRQTPGDHNALGRYKFHLTHENAIYLHDTPKKYLFDRPDRALSSGCIRVEGADTLARQLLADQYGPRRLQSYLNQPTRWLKLSQPIPVYLVYWSAWMEQGIAHFRRDIYGMESPAQLNAEADKELVSNSEAMIVQ